MTRRHRQRRDQPPSPPRAHPVDPNLEYEEPYELPVPPMRHPVERNFERDAFDEPELRRLPNPAVPVAEVQAPHIPAAHAPAHDLAPPVPAEAVEDVPLGDVEIAPLPFAAEPVPVIQDAPENNEQAFVPAGVMEHDDNGEPDGEEVNAAAPNENQNPMDPPIVGVARNVPKKKNRQPQPHPVEQHFEADEFDEPAADMPIEDVPLGDEPVEDILVRNVEVAYLPLAAVLDPIIQDVNEQALVNVEVLELEISEEQNVGEIDEAAVPNEIQNRLVAPDEFDVRNLRENKDETKHNRKRKTDGKKNSPKRKTTNRKRGQCISPNTSPQISPEASPEKPSTSNAHVSQAKNTSAEIPRLELVDLIKEIVETVSSVSPPKKSMSRLHQDLQAKLSDVKNLNELYETVHKFFVKLLKMTKRVKTGEIYENVMAKLRNLGLCCGQLQEYKATTMSCEGGKCEGIEANEFYYGYKEEDGEEYCYCVTCFETDSMTASYLTLSDDKEVHKNRFEECYNIAIAEPLIECNACRNFKHEACKALQESSMKCKCYLKPSFDFDKLPTNMLTNFVEEELRQLDFVKFLKVKIVRNRTAMATIGKEMKELFEKMKIPPPKQIRCKERKILIYQQQGSIFVNFLSFSVKEYETGWIVLYYLDSVQHLDVDPKYRSVVYRRVLNAYFNYAESCGYQMAHIWADAPKEGVEFFFNERPKDQHWCTQKQLEGWYKKMLDEGNREYRMEYNFKKTKSYSELYEVLQFSDFFMECMEEYIESLDGKKVTFNGLKAHLVKKAGKRNGALFYINLCADPFKREVIINDADQEIKCPIAVTKEDWINFQFQNKYTFDTRRNAQFASIKTIEFLNEKIEVIEDPAE